ncbi:site-specific DNA-methyltransferase [Phormidium sp. FACHB-1136]|jgi:site-specific DNA-methyltransferase (adenine-specific)|uniref:DNA-methyltransferase n=1 Tax=Phormidium sp. FACHB-1136 TaxID=2692848 RepID=UPI001682CBCF|nr:site-specific DNA-methyltransferase [Phormidium sp. FACHB-1136]MBD2424956.1 site-specific DNA-methyltransferase [Phormidium sp. FACHB-1136]
MKKRAICNRTLTCSDQELLELSRYLLTLNSQVGVDDINGRVIQQDFFDVAQYLPKESIDLLIMDPPYNLSKNYNGHLFKEKEKGAYQDWFLSVLELVKPLLKTTATIYVCSDWKTSIIIAPLLEQEFYVRSRVAWEREKGRGSKSNWKNNTEDIWFCTVTDKYIFNVDAVKQKRKVIAPYRHKDGQPKDWQEEEDGNFRLTYPSNIWTDISIPFWSMPENTDHPTQKPEKLIAKLILASSKPGDLVFDPFLGSGTTAVVAKKLDRSFAGIELNQEYCCWALKRLNLAEKDASIQGYVDGIFWERNTLSKRSK